MLWFMNTRRNPKGVIILPNMPQVMIFFRQLREVHQTSKLRLGGEMFAKRYDFGPQWYCQGLATDKEDKFNGPHQDEGGLFVIIDEASGVRDFAFNSVQGYLTGPDCYWLITGNGLRPSGPFFESHHASSRFEKFSISAYDVPPHIMRPEWIEESKELYLEGSPAWEARVLGRFPAAGASYQLISNATLEFALENFKPSANEGKHIGLDVARGGHDNNVAVLTNNGVLCDYRPWHSDDTMVTAKNLAALATEWDVPAGNIHVEVDGIGGAVVDRCREMNMTIDAVRSGALPIGDWKDLTGDIVFVNRKSELAFAGRQGLMNGQLKIPREFRQFWNDLVKINYDPLKENGKYALESKRKLISRTGKSPDYADAWFISLSRAAAVPVICWV